VPVASPHEAAAALRAAIADGTDVRRLRESAGVLAWLAADYPQLTPEIIEEREGIWRLIGVLNRHGEGIVLPAMGPNMATVDLRNWYEVRNWNRVDPIRPEFIERFATASRAAGGTLRPKTKGLINGK
jgi:hypothetical protein